MWRDGPGLALFARDFVGGARGDKFAALDFNFPFCGLDNFRFRFRARASKGQNGARDAGKAAGGADEPEERPRSRKPVANPVRRVLFSSFIIQ